MVCVCVYLCNIHGVEYSVYVPTTVDFNLQVIWHAFSDVVDIELHILNNMCYGY